MTINAYLDDLATRAIIRDDEKEGIQTSIDTIISRLENYDSYRNQIAKILIFGSYKRRTIISRQFDDNSDIDIMVVFGKVINGFAITPRNYQFQKPQIYLTYLKNFAEYKYSRSEIYKSHPAIVLELNHIKFELVPAIIDDWGKYKIPNNKIFNDWLYQEWMETNPNDLDGKLENNPILRRLVRVAKIWNAKHGYIFTSYELEKWIVNQYYFGNLAQHFYIFCNNLSIKNPYDYQIKHLKEFFHYAIQNDNSDYIKHLFE